VAAIKLSIALARSLSPLLVATSLLATPGPAQREGVGSAASTEGYLLNVGQWPGSVVALGRQGDMRAWVEATGATIALSGRTPEGEPTVDWVRITLEGCEASNQFEPRDALPGEHHFFLGSNPRRWRTGVRAYKTLHAQEVIPGVDITWLTRDGRLAFDFVVKDAPNVAPLRLRIDGAEVLKTAPDGALAIGTRLGQLRLSPLVSWWEASDGRRQPAECRYRILDAGRVVIEFPKDSLARRLVIDPALEWSSYLGGAAAGEAIERVAFGPDGTLFVTGESGSFDYPVTPGAWDTSHAGGTLGADIVLTKFSNGALVFSTFIGGGQNEFVYGLDINAAGEVFLGGWTSSSDYPTTPGAFSTRWNFSEGFVTKLSASGSALAYSTFVGGNSNDSIGALKHLADGTVILSGTTLSHDFPVSPDAFDTVGGSGPFADAFVARLSADGSRLLRSTFLGGSLSEGAGSLDVTSGGAVVVLVGSSSADFVPTHVLGSGPKIVRLNPDFTSVDYIAQIPNPGIAGALDAQERFIVIGTTSSETLSTSAGVVQPSFGGTTDGFIQRLAADGSAIDWATYLGGEDKDSPLALHVSPSGVLTVAGYTASDAFPITAGAFQTTRAGSSDLFASRLHPEASSLWYSTYLGGSGAETGDGSLVLGLAVGPEGEAAVVSETKSLDFPTTSDGFQTRFAGLVDGTVSVLSMLPTGVEKLGSSTPGCAGPLPIGVTAMPALGASDFALTCAQAAPFASGWLLLGVSALDLPLSVHGVSVWIDPSRRLVALPLQADAAGAAQYPLRLPQAPFLVGTTVFAQFLWRDACAAGGLAASQALAITFQP